MQSHLLSETSATYASTSAAAAAAAADADARADALRYNFLTCLFLTAQNGFGRDVEPFLALPRETWGEEQLWAAIKDLPHGALELKGADGSPRWEHDACHGGAAGHPAGLGSRCGGAAAAAGGGTKQLGVEANTTPIYLSDAPAFVCFKPPPPSTRCCRGPLSVSVHHLWGSKRRMWACAAPLG